MRRGTFAVLLTAVLGVALALAPGAMAGNGNGPDTKNVGPNYNHGKAMPYNPALDDAGINFAAPKGPAKIGDQKAWPALDDLKGAFLKYFTLKGAGDHIEVWVANKLTFPNKDDCRNNFVQITDAQVQSLIHEFDTNIYPHESEAFSVPGKRQGSGGKYLARDVFGKQIPSSYYVGDGKDIVVLIDNVRDANYYEPTTPAGSTYIAGFFWSYLDDLVDRNVMTIDAYDWVHRTGANPPDDTGNTGCSLVTGVPRPHMYEGTFAHEYQHLLESYSDPDEVSWVNEGLSDWAQTLVGYANPNIPHDQIGADSHIACFEGWNETQGGPENSLTLWGDQGDEILCDYGAAYSFMQMLATRYGDPFMSALHKAPGNGLQGLDQVLAQFATGKTAMQVVHEWAALMALDNYTALPDYSSTGLWSTINWDTPQAYSTPGAPPNGSDYVRLRDGADAYLGASQLSTISFAGGNTLVPRPVLWTEDGGALYSGYGDLFDRAIAREVDVPTDNPTLTFTQRYNLEQYWDFGFVQVSADGGATYTSIACPGTTSTYDPAAYPTVKTNVPGFTGVQDWTTTTCDLSAYKGQTVLISFRNITDWGTTGNGTSVGFDPGWWVKDVQVSGAGVGDNTLAGWKSPTEVKPLPNPGSFTVQLVSYSSDGSVAKVSTLPLDSSFAGTLSGVALQSAVAPGADVVAAIVMLDEPSETAIDYAPYTLTVNGVVQPGGS